ncbi:MAG: type II toxin-antitoxin system VapC family toxin [Gemmataceae bacterium]
MEVRLDMHSRVRFAVSVPQVFATGRTVIADPANEVLVSPASYWEIAIKVSLGKWRLQQPFADLIDSLWTVYGFRVLHITPDHAERLLTLPHPQNHRDPFDRLLIAQALAEGMPLVSVDDKLDQYGVTRVWA